MHDAYNSDPLGADGTGWVPGSSAVSECSEPLAVVVWNDPGEVLLATFSTGTGNDIIPTGVNVTLELVISGGALHSCILTTHLPWRERERDASARITRHYLPWPSLSCQPIY